MTDDDFMDGMADAIVAAIEKQIAPLQSRVQTLEAEAKAREETLRSVQRQLDRHVTHLSSLESRRGRLRCIRRSHRNASLRSLLIRFRRSQKRIMRLAGM